MSVAEPDKQLCFALYSASSRITAIYRPLLKPLGITYTQFVVLMLLWQEDNISITSLAKRAGLTNATMTPLLKLLEKKGYIDRKMLPDNERQKAIVLTDSGRKLSRKSGGIADQVFCATGLSLQEANSMIALCNKIAVKNE